MRCVDITKYGGPEVFYSLRIVMYQVMKVVTRDVPTPKKGEMLNRPDVIQVRFSFWR